MAISPQKLLPQSGSTGVRLSSSLVKTSNLGIARRPITSGQDIQAPSGGKLVLISDTLLNINNILSQRVKENTEQVKERKLVEDKKEKQKEEKELELKPQKNKINLPKIQTPFASFFDRLKNALVLLFVGWLVNTFFEYIPKILEGVSNFMKTLEDIRRFLKPAMDALGSALYNVTLVGTKTLGALTGASIDKNEKDLAVAINELDKKFSIVNALMAGVVIGDIFSAVADGLDLFERPGRGGGAGGGGRTGPYQYDPKRALIRKKYGDAFARLYDLEISKGLNSEQARKNVLSRYVNKGKITPQRMMGSLGGTETGSNLFGRGLRRVPGRLATRVLGRGGLRLAGKVFGRIPIIGGLIDFVINLAMGEKPGRAAAKAIGATVGAGLGTLIPIPFAGTILGGFLGDLLGGVVYDMFANKPTLKKGPKKKTEKPKGYFLGGLVSGVRSFFSPRPAKVSKPFSSTGRSQKLVQQTPTYPGTVPGLRIDPQLTNRISGEVLKGFSDVSASLYGVPFFGPFAALGINLALGQQRFSKGMAFGIASGIGNLLGNPLSTAIYNFFDRAMPGLGNLVQKVVGKGFGSFLSNWITQFLGTELYKSIYPMIDFIKNLMKVAEGQAKVAAEGKKEDGQVIGGDVSPVNVPSGKDDKIKAALAFYKSKGFSDSGAAYMVGNLLQESGLRPDAIGDNGKAFGLAQWRIDQASGARWLGYLKWAKANGKQAGDFYAQLEYTIVEGQKYNAGLTSMKGNDKNAHKRFIKGYEGYSVEGNRFGYAEGILKNYQKYGLKKGQGGGNFKRTSNSPMNIKPSKPSSISAMAYPGVSNFASYDRPSTQLQVVRQIVYVPMNKQQSGGGGVVMMGGGGVNNIDYQIAATKAAL